ncbi:MAG: DUF1800 domain-containing protein [Fimbriimonadales bacterium]
MVKVNPTPDQGSPGLSRRRILGLGLGGLAVAGCGRVAYRIQGDDLPASIELPKFDVHPTVRLLNRAGFGPKPGQVAEVEKYGSKAWVAHQLDPTEDEPVALSLQLGNLDALSTDSAELRDETDDEVIVQIQAAALLRHTYSPWQVRERMVDFWTNHFNIYARKGLGAYQKPADDAEVIRANALGGFPALLKASAHSPAMLAYLDNQVNRAGVANENYARELMELHTLGLHGGYTQKDVQEVARCFTGWTVETRFGYRAGSFRFDESVHDNRSKLVLGHVIPAGGGEQDAMLVLAILAKHPSTARFIATKMCRHFLGTTDSPWVDRLAKIYLETGGDIKAMLKPLLLSPELLEGPSVSKRPLDFVVSALRVFDAESDCGPALQQHLATMGQSPYEWPMPDGYPDRTSAWTGSMLARWNFAMALTSGQVRQTRVDFGKLGRKMMGLKLRDLALQTSPQLDQVVARHSATDPAKAAALALCAPEFQWR